MLLALLIFCLSLFVGNSGVKIPLSSDQKVDSTFTEKPQEIVINGHKFVDLGLPSGLLWADTNVGASSASDDGDYFAWGETEPKSYYDWSTYKWDDGNKTKKYDLSDNKTTLDAEDDVATVKWGAPCRMPDSSEFSELDNKCDWSWKSSYNGTSGYLVTGPNGRTIFFPASGGRYDDDLCGHCLYGSYSSRSRSECVHGIYRLEFDSARVGVLCHSYNRCDGFTVRPVAEKTRWAKAPRPSME